MMTANSDTSPTIGRYQLIAEIGRGGMSTVYLAIMRGMAGFDKLLVVKVLRDTTSQPQEMAQFMSEAQLAARLNHPNVVQSHEVGEDDGRYFIAMEYLEGQPLSRIGRPSSQQALPLELHVRVLCDVLSALHYAHELTDYDGQSLGIVHRDVSPQNVFVTYDGVVKLLDFGIAKSTVVAGEETRTGIIKGKIGYLAPEQLTSGRTTQRVDIFAVGLMLWEALTGRRIWDGLSEYDILLQLARREIPSARTICPDLPEALLTICERALKPEPEERFATALEFRLALEEYLGSFTSRASSAAVAKYMNDRFGEERRKMRAVVKQRLAALQAADPSSDVMVALPTLSAIRGEPTLSGSRRFSRQTTSARYALAAETLPQPAPVPNSPSKRNWLIGGSTAVAALLVGLATRHPLASEVASAAAVTPVAAVAPVLPPAVPVPTQPPAPAATHEAPPTEVRLSASPPEARLYLDNAPLPSNPYTGKFARNAIAHQLRVEAPGYQSRTELIDFESDRTVSIDLAKLPVSTGVIRRAPPAHTIPLPQSSRARAGEAAPPTESSVAASPPAGAPTPRSTAASTRELDDSMPFHAPKRIDESNPFK